MIEAHELTKRYGDTTAVHSLSFTIAPGTVTGFLGPNGAGKSTTMRMIMGLDRPSSRFAQWRWANWLARVRYRRSMWPACSASATASARSPRSSSFDSIARRRCWRASNYSVTAIAQSCGYSDPLHFSRRFRNVYDASPRAYRQEGPRPSPLTTAGLLPLARRLSPYRPQPGR